LYIFQKIFTFLLFFVLKWGPRQPWHRARHERGYYVSPVVANLLTDGFVALFARSNADTFGQVEYEYLAVADLARSCAVNDCLNGRFDKRIVHRYLNLNFSQQAALLLVAPVNFGYTFLPAPAHNVRYCNQVNLFFR
jgi:hypothetical protein